MECYDIAIIGGGVMGAATAYSVSKFHQKKKIILIEQFDFLHRQGSSHGLSRIIRRTYPEDHYTEMMSTAYKLWREAEMASGVQVYTKTGGLDFGKKGNLELESLIAAARRQNVPHDYFENGSEINKKFPNWNLTNDYVGLFCPEAGILNATKATSMFLELARANGCVTLDRSPVNRIEELSEGKIRISTASGNFIAKYCIVTAGSWTNKLLNLIHPLRIQLPLKPVQVTVAYYKVDDPEKFSAEKFPLFINYNDIHIYGFPCHEYEGIIKCAVHSGDPVNLDERSFRPDNHRIENFAKPFLQNFLKGVSTLPVQTENCLYTTLSNRSSFFLDYLPNEHKNFIVAAGFNGQGFKLAPLVGKMVSSMLYGHDEIHPCPHLRSLFEIRDSIEIKSMY